MNLKVESMIASRAVWMELNSLLRTTSMSWKPKTNSSTKFCWNPKNSRLQRWVTYKIGFLRLLTIMSLIEQKDSSKSRPNIWNLKTQNSRKQEKWCKLPWKEQNKTRNKWWDREKYLRKKPYKWENQFRCYLWWLSSS